MAGLGVPVPGTPREGSVRMLKTAINQLLCNEGRGGPASKCGARVVAVVDDDDGFRDALQVFLRTFGFQVEAFASEGVSAVEPTGGGRVRDSRSCDARNERS